MKMLVCSIGSKRRRATLGFAAEVAHALSADTTLLGIVDKKSKIDTLARRLHKTGQKLIEQNLQATIQVQAGNAESIIMDELARGTYDMVAVGALSDKRSRRTPLNSIGMRIVERADCSVLLIKGQRPSLSRILICASATEYGHMAIWAGAALACASGAKATVLHVASAMPTMYAGLEQMEESLAEFLQSDSETARELKWAAQVIKAECEVSEVKLRRGIVADEILLEAEQQDYNLVVMGSSRYPGGIVRALLGDLNRIVAHRTQRPILIVRPMH